MPSSIQLETLRVMRMFGWKSKTFATEYAIARFQGGSSHLGAIREAKRSPFIKPWDVPPGL